MSSWFSLEGQGYREGSSAPKGPQEASGKASKEEAKLNQIKEGESAEELVIVDVPGGYKRCGGQGDVLSGAVGTIMAWGKCYEEGAYGCVLSAS